MAGGVLTRLAGVMLPVARTDGGGRRVNHMGKDQPTTRVPWWLRWAYRLTGMVEWTLRDKPELIEAGWTKDKDGWWHPPGMGEADAEAGD